MSKKILIVLTSTEKYPTMATPTGLWLGEAVHFVKRVEDAGFEVDYVSPLGGYTPIDPKCFSMADSTDWEYYSKKCFMNRLGATLKPTDINPEDYIAIYYTGGHGTVFDFLNNEKLQEISQKIYDKGGYVTSVCHGSIGLLNIKKSDGSFLIKGKKVTGFSNEEEKIVELDQHVPFLTETEIVARGAIYQKAANPWEAFAVEDDRVISGQNPASAGSVADLLLKHIK